MDDKGAESFLTRWARLKRQPGAARSHSSVPERSPVSKRDERSNTAAETGDGPVPGERAAAPASPQPDTVSAPGNVGAPNAATFEDVDFAALDHTSDYTRFMQPGVPDAVRQQALRRLWATDPVLALPDELNDYMGDYTDAAVAVPSRLMKTAYKVGRGFLDDDEVAAWEALGRPAAAPTATAGAMAPLEPEKVPGTAPPSGADGVQPAAEASSHAPRAEETEISSAMAEETTEVPPRERQG